MRFRAPWIAAPLCALAMLAGMLTGAPQPAAAATSPDLVPLNPVRVWDSRPAQPRGTSDRPARLLVPGATFRIPISRTPGLPADARALVLNIAATEVRGRGFVTVWPCGSRRPGTSTLNAAAGETTANQVTVALDRTRAICAASSVPLHLIVDANAYAPASSGLTVRVPFRLLDTRAAKGKVAGNQVLRVPVAGRHNVPGDARLALVNLTATGAARGGYVTAYPCGGRVPLASALNYRAGENRANAAWVALDASGALCLRPSTGTHLVVDVSGHAPQRAAGIVPVPPDRVVDSRHGRGLTQPLAARATASFGVGQLTGSQGYRGLLLLNVTTTGQHRTGHLTVWPCGRPLPNASSLNFAAGRDRANAVAVAPGANGRICVRSSTTLHLVVDVAGFVNPAAGQYRYVPAPVLVAGMTATETTMLQATNAARSVGRSCGQYGSFPPAPALRPSHQLATAAQRHGDDLARHDFFSHTGSNGSSVRDRINAAGPGWTLPAENLAAGYSSAQAAVAGLLESPGHCRNIMDRRFNHAGMAYSHDSLAKYRHYWVQVFASR